MDIDYWLEFYRKWHREQLIIELDTCHKYQRILLADGCSGKFPYETLYNLMVQSQTRENIIYQILEEKAVERGITHGRQTN